MLLATQLGRGLAGSLRVVGTEPRPVELTLQAAATIIGRLVDGEGRPHEADSVRFGYGRWTLDGWTILGPQLSRTLRVRDGRFRIEGIIPGVEATLHVGPARDWSGEAARVTLQPGEVRDLGDVRVRPAQVKPTPGPGLPR